MMEEEQRIRNAFGIANDFLTPVLDRGMHVRDARL
jgi:hypothetical protein